MVVITAFLCSCVSIEHKTLPVNAKNDVEVVGQVEVEFSTFQFLHIPYPIGGKGKAYKLLLKKAREQYSDDSDVVNIKIKGVGLTALGYAQVLLGGSAVPAAGMVLIAYEAQGDGPYIAGTMAIAAAGILAIGNFQEVKATGDVIVYETAQKKLKRTVEKSLNVLSTKVPKNSRVAVLSISSPTIENSEYVVYELEYLLVNKSAYTVVERKKLDLIRTEQNLQMSADIDDKSAVSIGHLLGASIVITGSISTINTQQILTLKALDVETGAIVAMSREEF